MKKRGRKQKSYTTGFICAHCSEQWGGKMKPKGDCCSKLCYDRRSRLKKAKKRNNTRGIPACEVLINEGDDVVVVWKGIFSDESAQLLTNVLKEVEFPDQIIIQHGIDVLEPRYVKFLGDEGVADMKYSGTRRKAETWTKTTLQIRDMLSTLTAALPRQPKFSMLNVALLNYYPRGRYYMGLHNDGDAAMGSDPFIMSVVLGSERPFVLQKKDGTKIITILPTGSVLAMLGSSIQQKWKHGVPRDDSILESRLNLSYRFHLKQKQVEKIDRVRKLASPQHALPKVLKALDY